MGFNPLKFVGGLIIGFVGTRIGSPYLQSLGASMMISSFGGGTKQGDVRRNLRRRQQSQLLYNRSNPGEPVPVVYGSVKVGMNINDFRLDTSSDVPKDLYIAGVMCHGSRKGLGIAAIDEVYYDERQAYTADGTHVAPFATTNTSITKMLGTEAQVWATTAIGGVSMVTNFATAWAATDAGGGMAGILAKLTHNPDVYPTGEPTITAKVRGNFVEDHRKEIDTSGADPRIAFTAATSVITRNTGHWSNDGWVVGDWVEVTGSVANDGIYEITAVGSTTITVDASLTDEALSTTETLKRWAHPDNGGANPALCVRDYLISDIFGVGIATSNINETSFDAAADYCDQTVTNPTTATQTRFTCNGWVDTGQTLGQCLQELLSACRGNLVYEGGEFRLFITQNTTATTFALTEDNIIGDWQFVTPGAQSKINKAQATYVDPDKSYAAVEIQWPRPGDANSYLTDDNSFENRLSLDLPFTTDPYMAEQIIMTRLKESRNGIMVTLRATEEALKLQIGDVVPVTHSTPGWTGKEFWVMGMGIRPDATVDMVLTEYVSTVYSYTTATTLVAEVSFVMPDPHTVQAPSTLVLTAATNEALVMGDGTYIPRIKVEFTASQDPYLSHYDIEARQTGEDYDTWGPMERDADSFMISPVVEGANWDVRVRAVNTAGVKSSWLQGSVTPAYGPVTATPTVDGFSAARNTAGPENSDVTVSADGAMVYSNLEDANNRATTYTAYFDIDGTGMSANLCTVKLYYSDDATAGSWHEADSATYEDTDNLTDETLSYSGALDANYDLMLELTYNVAPGANLASLVAHGEDHGTEPGVQYDKIT